MLLQDAVELEQLAQHRRGLGELDQENWVTLGPTPPPARAGPAGTPTEGRRFARAPFDLAPLALRGLSWGGLDIDPRAGLEPEEALLERDLEHGIPHNGARSRPEVASKQHYE